jgi:hypothetical protein
MDYDSIIHNVSSGVYKSKLNYDEIAEPLVENTVVDENQTVAWNRLRIKEHNDKIAAEWMAYHRDVLRLQVQFKSDLISVIAENLSITTKKAEHIYLKAYDDEQVADRASEAYFNIIGHTGDHEINYFNIIDRAGDLCDLIAKIL